MGPGEECGHTSGAWLRLRLRQPIFANGWVEVEDARANYGETRMKAIGQAEADILVVVYTVRGTALRIISARRANRKERR
jgi:uncharacterized protein